MLTKSELAYFCYQLSIVFRSGLPIAEGIHLLAADFDDKRFTEIASKMAQSLDEGSTITDAILATGAFPVYLNEMTRIGEDTGRLGAIFSELAAFYEGQANFAKKIRSALTYPIVLGVLMFAVLMLLVFNVLPVFHEMLLSFGGAVPATTEWILKISMLARHSVAFIVGVLVLFFIGMFLVFKTNRVPRQRNFVLTKIPIISRIYKKSVLVKFSRALQTLISSGYSFEMSVEKTLPILEDPVIADRLSSAAREIEAGGDLYEILNRLDLFPRVFFKMIQLGVKTGTLEEMITKFTATYERELEADLTQTTDAIEPVLVAVLSVVIGLILVMVMLPLINIIGAIG